MTLYKWSRTAADNDDIDSTIDWAEGMPPSNVNNSSRAEMAAVAKWRDDTSGLAVTGGSSTAYTYTSFQVTTALLDGFSVTLRMHTTSGAAPTLNVDAQGAKAVRTHSGTAVATGALLAGATHKFTYDAGDDCWYVNSFFNIGVIDLATQVTGTLSLTNGGTGQTSASAAFGALKQAADETNTGVLDLATDAEIRAATTGAHALTAADLESAAALVTITDGATITPDWDAFINGQITLAGNRTLNAPTNLQTMVWRQIWIQGNDGTDRTLTLGAGYLGPNVALWNALTFNSSTKRYIMGLLALNSSNAVLVAPPLGPF